MTRFAKRIYKSLIETCCKQRLVFFHIPKCGGNSVGKGIPMRYLLSRATIGPEEAFRAVEAMWPKMSGIRLSKKSYIFREELFIYLLMKDVRFIWAHIEFNETAYDMFKDKYMFITMLREPVDRYISNYFYDRTFEPDSPFYISEGLDEFINTERGIQFGRRYCEFFSGLPPAVDFNVVQAVHLAKENLQKFSIVGFLTDPKDFADRLKKAIGCRVKIGHKNKGLTSPSKKASELTPEIRERIRKICEPDIEIYEYARVKFGTR